MRWRRLRGLWLPGAADALLKAVDDPPDLVVCDYRMPGMDGRQLVEKLKSRPATANFSAVLMASRSDIDERLSPQDAADDYLAKPFFLKEATRRIKRTVDRIALEKMAKTAPSDGVVRGNLSQMNVIDLMQSLEMGRKSCQLKLNNEGEKCEVFFVEGQVKHATYGSYREMRLSSKFCAGPAETSNSISKARQIRKPRSSTPRVC